MRHVFRERQVYVRSDSALRYIVVRPWHLTAAAGILCLCMAWLSASTVSFIYSTYEVSDARSMTERVQQLYDGRLAKMQTAVERLNEKLMLDQGAYLGKVDDLRGDYDQLVDRQHRLEVFFRQGWIPARELNQEAADQDPTPKPQSTLIPEYGTIFRHSATRSGEFRTRAQAEQPLQDVRKIFAAFESRQAVLLSRIIAFGERKVASLRKVYSTIGLDPTEVAANISLPSDAIGGPLLPVQKGERPQDALDQQLLKAHQAFLEAEKLRHAITLMPITLPLSKDYRLTSGFGFRRDPFKDVLAMHTGVDLMTAYGATIRATADGVVIRAEMNEVYGRVVDIRHDNGITTRYAHMSAMDVTEGERVTVNQAIGRVGTSGRSTGPHLHYETRVNGDPIDPYEFLRVARDVLQEKGK